MNILKQHNQSPQSPPNLWISATLLQVKTMCIALKCTCSSESCILETRRRRNICSVTDSYSQDLYLVRSRTFWQNIVISWSMCQLIDISMQALPKTNHYLLYFWELMCFCWNRNHWTNFSSFHTDLLPQFPWRPIRLSIQTVYSL